MVTPICCLQNEDTFAGGGLRDLLCSRHSMKAQALFTVRCHHNILSTYHRKWYDGFPRICEPYVDKKSKWNGTLRS